MLYQLSYTRSKHCRIAISDCLELTESYKSAIEIENSILLVQGVGFEPT